MAGVADCCFARGLAWLIPVMPCKASRSFKQGASTVSRPDDCSWPGCCGHIGNERVWGGAGMRQSQSPSLRLEAEAVQLWGVGCSTLNPKP